ncbi:MAG: zinc ribbon domain-containing protein [Limnospira sp.]
MSQNRCSSRRRRRYRSDRPDEWNSGQLPHRFSRGSHESLWQAVRLSVREWTCLNCGTVHDQDENAAKNI